MRRISLKHMISIHNTFGLPMLIAAAVFSTSRLLFWEKEVADWVGYLVVHLLATATIWSMLKVIYRLPSHQRASEESQTCQRNHMIRVLTMTVLLLATAAVVYVELMSGAHPMFK